MTAALSARWAGVEDRLERLRPGFGRTARDGQPTRRRNIAVDVLMVLLSLVLGLLGANSLLNGLHGHPLWLRVLDVALAAVAYVAFWFRRRYPLAFALLVLPVSVVSTLAAGLSLVAVFTVAIRRRWPTAVLVSALFWISAWPATVLYPDGDLAWTLALVTVVTFAFTGWGMFVRARRELVANLRERAELAEADRQIQLDLARQSERERIAREMHDVLAHRLSLLAVHAGALEYRTDADAADIATAAGVIRANAHEGLTELRSVVRLLRQESAATAPPQPTLADVPELVAQSRRAGAAVDLQLEIDDPATMTPGAGRTVYRVVQEGLTNARKHAPGSAVRVRVAGGREHGLDVAVVSPLPVNRVAAVPGAGVGLIGLAERATLAGGRLEHGPTDDGSFRLEAWLPW